MSPNPFCPNLLEPMEAIRRRRVLLLIIALGLAMRLFHLTYRGLWTDELTTLATIRMPAAELTESRMARGHFPTYFLLLQGWARLFGESEAALRLPSVLLGTASIFFVWAAARRLCGEKAALFAALFYCVHERAVWSSQEARPYALAMLAAAGSFHALAIAVETRRRGAWSGYAAWTILGLASSSAYAPVFVGQALTMGGWLTLRRQWRGDWAGWSATLCAAGAGGLALLAYRQTNLGFYAEPGWPPWSAQVEALAHVFWGQYGRAFGSTFRWFAFAFIVIILWLAWLARPRSGGRLTGERPTPGFALAVAWALSVFLGLTIVSGVFRDVTGNFRYYGLGAGGASLLQGAAIAGLRHCRFRALLAVLVLAPLTAASVGWLYHPGDGIREAALHVAGEREPGEPVIICHDSHAETLADYYGIGVAPAALSNQVSDREAIACFLDDTVGDATGFWVIRYKDKGSPLSEIAEDWAAGRFGAPQRSRFRQAWVEHYRQEERAGDEPDRRRSLQGQKAPLPKMTAGTVRSRMTASNQKDWFRM